MTIYFDLDGVLADFDVLAEQVVGTDNIYKFEWLHGEEAFWSRINEKTDFFASLPMMCGAREMLEHTRHLETAILTALPKSRPEDVDRQKRDWVRRNISYHMPVITCLTKDKPNYCQPGDILIDDRSLNRAAWERAGGQYIVHLNATDTINALRRLEVI